MALPELTWFSSRLVVGLQPAQLLPRIEILHQHEQNLVAFRSNAHYNRIVVIQTLLNCFFLLG